VDHRADLYAVGVILHEMLTGQAPYQADTAMEIMSMHLTAPLPLLSRYGDFPHGLQDLLNRAMAKKTDYRYDDAAEFLIDIERIDPDGGPAQIEFLERVRNAAEPLIRHLWNHPFIRKIKKRLLKVPAEARYYFRTAIQWILASRRNRIIAGSVAGVLLLLIITVNMCSNQDETPPSAFVEKKAPLPPIKVAEKLEDVGPNTEAIREFLEKAEAQLQANQPEEAVITIKKALLLQPDAAAVKLLLGHAQFLSGNQALAVFNYDQALKIDSGLAGEKRLIANLKEALERPEAREKAALLLARFGDAEVITTLVALANSALSGGEIRRAARNALVANDQSDRVDWVSSLTADFHEDKSCAYRKHVIAEMKKTKNPAFIALLEEYLPKTARGRGSRKTANACIGKDVKDAIDALGGAGKPETGDSTAGGR